MPGVRELFEQEPPLPPRKTRAELMKDIDADYYGYKDDDDGIILPLEQKSEQEYRELLMEEWKEKGNNKEAEPPAAEEEPQTSQMHIPSQSEIQEALLLRKKQELLEKYVN